MHPETMWSTAPGRELLERARSLAEENHYDATATALRANKKLNDAPPEQARRAIEIIFTRRQAAFMGAWAAQGLFTRESIEQASHPAVASRHALRFKNCRHVLEIGTGIGIDTAAIARVASRVTSIERKENLACMARHNLACQGISNVEVLTGDALEILPTLNLASFDGLWTDPARRDAGGNRMYNPNDWSPPLSFVLNVQIAGPHGIKISPGVNLTPPPDVIREWIGLGDECLEQTLWSGAGNQDGVVFLADRNLEWIPPLPARDAEEFPIEQLQSGWLVEPHAALIRSAHLGSFFHTQGIKLLDPHIAYGVCSSEPPSHPLYERFKVLESFRFTVSLLNERLQARRWNSRSEIKKRGLSETTDELRRKLSLASAQAKETDFGVIFVTRVGTEHYAILATRA